MIPLGRRLGADRSRSSCSASASPGTRGAGAARDRARGRSASCCCCGRSDPDERAWRAGGRRDRGRRAGAQSLLIAAGIDDLITRNVLALWMPAAVAVAGGLAARARSARRPRRRGRAVRDRGRRRGRRRDQPQLPAPGLARRRAVARCPPPAARAAAVPVARSCPALPRPAAAVAVRAGPAVPPRTGRVASRELDVVAFSSPRSAGFCWWGAACNLWPSRCRAVIRSRASGSLAAARSYQFTVLRMVATGGPVTLTAPKVSRVLTTTALRQRRAAAPALRAPPTSAGLSRRYRPGCEIPQLERAERDPLEPLDRVADRLAHPPHLALAALVDRELDRVGREPAHAARARSRPSSSSTPARSAAQRARSRTGGPATSAR